MRADIQAGPMGTGRIVLDGTDFSAGVAGISLDARVGELTRLRLDVLFVELAFQGEVRVEIPARSHDALVALGWTPPAAEGGGADG